MVATETTMRRLLLAFSLLVLATGCNSRSADFRMAAIPPSGRVVGFDPSVVGLPGAINDTVYDSAGVISWVKYGTGNTAWRPVPISQIAPGDPTHDAGVRAPVGFTLFANDGTNAWVKSPDGGATGWTVFPAGLSSGGGAGTVATDSTLVGNGSAGSPLGINPVAARAPDWFGYCKALFVQKSGISPLSVVTLYANEFGDGAQGVALNNGGNGASATSPGTVSMLNPGATASGHGGVIKMVGGTGTGRADWESGGASGLPNFAVNTHKWMICYRSAVAKAPAAGSLVMLGFAGGGHWIGIGFIGNTSTYHFIDSAFGSEANGVDTGQAIDSTGSVFRTQYIANVDNTNVIINPWVEGGAADVVGESFASLPANAVGEEHVYLAGSNADVLYLDAVVAVAQK